MSRLLAILTIIFCTLACAWVTAPAPAVGAATSYEFTLIADTVTGPFKSLSRTPSINNNGTVAFQAGWAGTYPGGRIAIYTGSGGTLTTIVDSADGVFYYFNLGGNPMINDSGTVAFFGTLNETGERGIFTGDGTSTTTIALVGDTYSNFSLIPAINDNGVVAFQASLTAGGQGIFTVDGATTTTIATTTTNSLGAPEINNAGEVAYWQRSGTSPGPFTFGIFKGDGSSTTTIAQTGSGSSFFNVGSYPGINDDGTVAFVGTILGAQGIFTGSGGLTTKIVDSTGPFSASFFSGNYHSINKSGKVAFQIGLDAGGDGIFVGPDVQRVIGQGDALFGSTVGHPTLPFLTTGNIGFFRDGLNDSGQLTFWARLTDGREVIARATPRVPGDLNGDGVVDRNDVNIINLYRNQPASVCPECDIDGDGKITILDARKLVLMCTCPNCLCN
jgi:hypothetical protein